MTGQAAGAIDFEVIHDDRIRAIKTEKDERVRHEHANGVEHVRVVVGIRDHQKIFFAHRI